MGILAFFFILPSIHSVFSLAHRFVDGWVFLGVTPSGRAELVLHSCLVSVTDVLPPQLASHSRTDSSPLFPQPEQALRSNRPSKRCPVTALPYVLQWATFYLGVFFFSSEFCSHAILPAFSSCVRELKLPPRARQLRFCSECSLSRTVDFVPDEIDARTSDDNMTPRGFSTSLLYTAMIMALHCNAGKDSFITWGRS